MISEEHKQEKKLMCEMHELKMKGPMALKSYFIRSSEFRETIHELVWNKCDEEYDGYTNYLVTTLYHIIRKMVREDLIEAEERGEEQYSLMQIERYRNG
mgnify:CR=1 FL=1